MDNGFNRIVSAAEYISQRRQLKLLLSDGSEHFIPIDCLQMEQWNGSSLEVVPRPSDSQLSKVQVWGGGQSVLFPDIEQVFSAEDLISGRYGDKQWMADLMAAAS